MILEEKLQKERKDLGEQLKKLIDLTNAKCKNVENVTVLKVHFSNI